MTVPQEEPLLHEPFILTIRKAFHKIRYFHIQQKRPNNFVYQIPLKWMEARRQGEYTVMHKLPNATTKI